MSDISEMTKPSIPSQPATSTPPPLASKDEMKALRNALLGKDFDELLELKSTFQDRAAYSQEIASVISEAIQLRLDQDGSLPEVLAPTIEGALSKSIKDDPQPIADALYPIMGPAIRKSIIETLNQMMASFNQMLEQSLSAKAIKWRLEALVTGKSYSETVMLHSLVYQVEQLFLIHQETGLLLQHVESDNIMSKDADMVSSMLTAIQDFVMDSFQTGQNDNLNTLRLGDLTVIVEKGPKATLAAAIRGTIPDHLPAQIAETLEAIHLNFHVPLEHYEGDSSQFDATQPLLKRCLINKVPTAKKKKPWIAIAALTLLVTGLGYYLYLNYKETTQWEQTIAELEQQEGLVVTDYSKQQDTYHINALKDPLAPHPEQLIAPEIQQTYPIEYHIKPYLSTEPGLALKRANRLLSAPKSVSLAINDHILFLSGSANVEWYKKVEQQWPMIAGVNGINSDDLRIKNPKLALRKQTINIIESTLFFYDKGVTSLSVDETDKLIELSNQINQLTTLARDTHSEALVYIIGTADETGDKQFNIKLRRERAINALRLLVTYGVPSGRVNIIEPQASNDPYSKIKQRAIRFEVKLEPTHTPIKDND